MNPSFSIEDVQAEALRLIDLQSSLLEQIRDSKILQADSEIQSTIDNRQSTINEGEAPRFFSPAEIAKKLEILAENRHKTEKLEMVLAVVGTMKAGKSTTINAIVGREILPNRNRPMTALPTLIEHAPGQKTPILYFEKRQPILDLIEKLEEKAQKLKPESLQERLEGDSHLQDALQKLHQTRSIAEAYQGEEAIFDFLAWLNDLVRLSAALKVPFPFEAYAGVADFPRIEVEFFHLRNQNQAGQGKFMILDTPGFNEAGQQEHLLPMMREQLEKASAVLAVLDYTQLKSESEKNLRDELEQIARHARDRMFALVNKFDNEDSNSDDAEKTCKYVAKQLLPRLNPEKIFPVSSRNAYLAQRAQLALTEGGIQWQEGQPASWIDDFGKKAFGEFWEDDISDNTKVQKRAGSMWKKSLFKAPLEKVIQYGHQTAALLAVAAAADVLAHNAKELTRFIKGRLQAQDVNREELRKLIASVKKQIGQLDEKRQEIRNKLFEEFSSTQYAIEEIMERTEESTKKNIAQLLEKGKLNMTECAKEIVLQMAKKQHWFTIGNEDNMKRRLDSSIEELPDDYETYLSTIKKLEKKNRFRSLDEMEDIIAGQDENSEPATLFGRPARIKRKEKLAQLGGLFSALFDPEGLGDTYESKEAADEVVNRIASSVQLILKNAGCDIGNQIKDKTEILRTQLLELRNEVEKQIEDFSKEAKEVNLDALAFNIPSYLDEWAFDELDEVDQPDFIKIETKTYTSRVRQDSVWGSVKRLFDWFDQDWGYDEVKRKEEYARLDTEGLKSYWNDKVTQVLQNLREQVQDDFMQPLQKSCDTFFDQVEQCFRQVQDSLQKGLHDQEREEEERMAIRAELKNLQQQHDGGEEDAASLNQWAAVQLEKHAAALARE